MNMKFISSNREIKVLNSAKAKNVQQKNSHSKEAQKFEQTSTFDIMLFTIT